MDGERHEADQIVARARFLRRLRWSAIVLPALFIFWTETVRHVVLERGTPDPVGNLVTAAVALIASFAFAQIIFGQIGRLDLDLMAYNRRLVTLNNLAALANAPTDEAAFLAAALPLLRESLGAAAVRFVPPGADLASPPTALVHPLRHDDAALGVLVIEGVGFGADDRLLAAAEKTLALALTNRRLAAQAARIAVLEERDRIARELHDGLAQMLATIALGSERVRMAIADGNAGATRAALDSIDRAAGIAYADVREAIVGLRVGAADDLPTALTETTARFEDTADVPVALDMDAALPPLPPAAELHLLRVVQEALTNVRKHAEATHVTVRLAADTVGAIHLTITDDGCGFDPAHLPRDGRQHFGLVIMRERVEGLGGTLTVHAQPGAGTTVRVTLPALVAEARGVA